MIANAVVDIWKAEGVSPVPKYEDNLKVFQVPSPTGVLHDGDFSFEYDHAEMLHRIASLGVPWHEEKGDNHFLFVTTFIRFCWDIPRKLISLLEEKRLKFHKCVRLFLNNFQGHPCHLLDVEKIHGSLCHVTFVYMDSRSHLPSLSNFASSFHNNKMVTRYLPHSMMTDLTWWLKKLDQQDVTRTLLPRGPLQDLGASASSWEILGPHSNFQLSPVWKVAGRDICWLETLAVELLTYFLEDMGFKNCRLLIHSDNQGTIGALDKGRSPNSHINLPACRTYLILSDLSITPEIVYIESATNPADPISCRDLGDTGKQILPTFKLPDELSDCFLHVQS